MSLYFLFFIFVAKHEIKQTLSLLQEVIVSVSYERKRSKDILYKSIESLMDNIVQLFDVYINEPGNRGRERGRRGGREQREGEGQKKRTVAYFIIFISIDILEVLMNFFYTLFHGLLSQVGPSLTERVTQTFMSLLTK